MDIVHAQTLGNVIQRIVIQVFRNWVEMGKIQEHNMSNKNIINIIVYV